MHHVRAGTWIAAIGFLAIAVATLTPVEGGGGGTSELCLICHARGMSDFLSNIILFAPLGFGLALRGVPLRRTALAAALFSLTIELLQLEVIAGRDSNVGDLAANSLGGIAGWLAWRTSGWWRPRPDGALARSIVIAAVALAVLIGALSLLVPAPPPTTYFIQWTADLGRLEHYSGRVLESKIGQLELRGAARFEPSDALRRLLVEPAWDVHFIAGDPPSSLAPIVSIYDDFQQEVMLLGARRNDVVYRQRLQAGALRFDEPDLRAYGALDRVQPGQTVSLGWLANRSRVCVRVDERETCSHGYTVGDTWALLMFPDSWGSTTRTAMGIAWLFGILVPAGFLAYQWGGLLASGTMVLVTLLVAPPVMGFAVTPAWQVIAALAGLVAGHVTARAVRRRFGSTESVRS